MSRVRGGGEGWEGGGGEALNANRRGAMNLREGEGEWRGGVKGAGGRASVTKRTWSRTAATTPNPVMCDTMPTTPFASVAGVGRKRVLQIE
jgi:hypothetical protein